MHRLRTTVARLRPLTAAQTAQSLSQPRLLVVGRSLRTFQLARCLNTSLTAEPFLNGTSSNYVEEMYYAWLENPRNVHKSWDIFFRNVNAGAPPGAAYQSPPPISGTSQGLASVQALVGAQPNVEKLVKDHLAVQSLIRAYQVRGHHIAKLDPLNIGCVDFDDAPCAVGFQNVGSGGAEVHRDQTKRQYEKLCVILNLQYVCLYLFMHPEFSQYKERLCNLMAECRTSPSNPNPSFMLFEWDVGCRPLAHIRQHSAH